MSERCIGDIVNLKEPIEFLGFQVTVPNVVGAILSGQSGGQILFDVALRTVGASTDSSLASWFIGTPYTSPKLLGDLHDDFVAPVDLRQS